MTFRERLTRADKDVLRLFVEDAREEGMSLRAYCKKHGVDYYLLTGFPRPWQEVPFREGFDGEKGTGGETDV
jgi:hypothetical protein